MASIEAIPKVRCDNCGFVCEKLPEKLPYGQPVLHHVRALAGARRDHRVRQHGIHVENPVNLLQSGGVEALQPQQVPSDQPEPSLRRQRGLPWVGESTRVAA